MEKIEEIEAIEVEIIINKDKAIGETEGKILMIHHCNQIIDHFYIDLAQMLYRRVLNSVIIENLIKEVKITEEVSASQFKEEEVEKEMIIKVIIRTECKIAVDLEEDLVVGEEEATEEVEEEMTEVEEAIKTKKQAMILLMKKFSNIKLLNKADNLKNNIKH